MLKPLPHWFCGSGAGLECSCFVSLVDAHGHALRVFEIGRVTHARDGALGKDDLAATLLDLFQYRVDIINVNNENSGGKVILVQHDGAVNAGVFFFTG